MVKERQTIAKSLRFRSFFVRGLAILLPSVLTLALLWWAGGFMWSNIAEPINRGVRSGVAWITPRVLDEASLPSWALVSEEDVRRVRAEWERIGRIPLGASLAEIEKAEASIRHEERLAKLHEVWRRRWYLQPIGLVIAILLVYLVGAVVGHYVGRRAFQSLESWAVRIPVVKQVYPSTKQLVEFLLGQGGAKSMLSGRVVLVEYPRKGLWSMGLLTNDSPASFSASVGKPCANVFVPSTPTPVTGFTISVPKDEIIEVSMTLDEAIRYVVSGGVLVPTPRDREPAGQMLLPMQGQDEATNANAERDLARNDAGAMMATTDGLKRPGG